MKLELRQLEVGDEPSFRSAVNEFEMETPPWEFAFQYDHNESFQSYVERVHSWPQGVENFVPSSYLIAVVEGKIVGRVSIRHELNDFLRQYGGHVGYGVVPSERRNGYATEILKQSLGFCRDLGLKKIMISCDIDNVGSQKVIEKNGGDFEKTTELSDLEIQKRIYWIEITKERTSRCRQLAQALASDLGARPKNV